MVPPGEEPPRIGHYGKYLHQGRCYSAFQHLQTATVQITSSQISIRSTPFIADTVARDLELVSSLVRVRNSGSSFQSNISNIFLERIQLLSVLSGIRYTGESAGRELTVLTRILFQSLYFDSEGDYPTGCRNVTHCRQQQQSYSGLRSPGLSNSTNF